MLKEKLQSITFNPAKEFEINENAKLIIYDEEKKSTLHTAEINENEEYKFSLTKLESHLRYLYKYQTKEDNKWVDKTKYKLLKVENITESGIKYLLYPKKASKYLVVGFQGISKKPGYNYVRSLKNIKAVQLYIKDDYGSDITQSSYYLGPKGNFKIADDTLNLIEEVRLKFGIDKKNVICIGSSKGGFASLYFAYKGKYGKAVVGGPQIKLGMYLSKGKDANNLDPNSFMPEILKYLLGNITNEGITKIDRILFDVIKESQHNPNIFIHVGKGEPHYQKHVIPFINYAKKLNLGNIKLDLGNYNKHSELATYFPPVLKKKVIELTK